MENEIRLTWVDTWLLLSILYSKKQDNTFEWKNVIGTGDVINHSIFNYEEINAGIENLVLTDYLSVNGNKIFVTNKALELFELLEKRNRYASSFTRLQQLEKELDVIPYSKVTCPNIYNESSLNTEQYITMQEYQNAIKQYKSKFFKSK